jgi:hypothetical protein
MSVEDELIKGAGRGEDVYEARYMPGAGGVVYRDKIIAPRWFHLLMSLPLLCSLIAALATGGGMIDLLPLLVAVPLLLFVWLTFSVLRITVSREQVVLQYGLLGPKIDVASLVSAEAVEYDWKRFGGWGIRRNMRGEWAYNMMGDAGHAVRLVYREGKRERILYVSSHHPALLADAIQRAMRGEVSDEEQIVFDTALHEAQSVDADAAVAAQHKRGG